MSQSNKILLTFYNYFLSEKVKQKSEVVIIYFAIISFLLHLLLIGLVNLDIIVINDHSKLLSNPISAIYTPFSFILIYEVYLLLYYLPKSTSIYIGKQYEIISLIVIRRIFKDLSNVEFSTNWFFIKNDILFTSDLIAILILFFLIFIFYRLVKEGIPTEPEIAKPKIMRFISLKQTIATCLVPVFLALSIYSLGHWLYESFFSISKIVTDIKDINKVFFDDFFTILILVDVLLLLFSFLHSDKFSRVIRNSGFIISTILIKLSFSTEGILNIVLIVTAIVFGVILLKIHNLYEKMEK
ncbi:hypothetical protein [Flavobacterium sp.]|uniref:hypothetical protein n=1 Tax=Flavobacterium sp. TaxID=239 RepID=UPI00286DA9C8|nr:hypothetical protein [Flavobacterium sp.]